MSKTISHDKSSIRALFSQRFYEIPNYQREYVWVSDNVEMLLQDIQESYQNDKNAEYFIGNIILSKQEDKEIYDVIDGQQRLTTLMLILLYLEKRHSNIDNDNMFSRFIYDYFCDSNGNNEKGYKLKPQYVDFAKLRDNINCLLSCTDDLNVFSVFGQNPTKSEKHIVEAYNTICGFFREFYQDEKELSLWCGYFLNKIILIQIETDLSNAIKVFETINARGIGLNPMDLLKNLLFQKADEKSFNIISEHWKEKVTKVLEEIDDKAPITFLRYFMSIEFGDKDGLIPEDKIFTILKQQRDRFSNSKTVLEFKDKIIAFVKSYNQLSHNQDINGNKSLALQDLRLLMGSKATLHYIPLLAIHCSISLATFEQIVRKIESYLFYCFIRKIQAKEYTRTFMEMAHEIKSYSKESDLLSFVNKFISGKLQINIREFDEQFQKYSAAANQKYKTRYILMKIEKYLQIEGRQDDEHELSFYARGGDIEHILPDNPDISFKNSIEDYDYYKNLLGNLTLLEKPINRSLGNSYFTEKKMDYENSVIYLTKSIVKQDSGINDTRKKINDKLQIFNNWGIDEIKNRQAILLSIAKDIFGFNGI